MNTSWVEPCGRVLGGVAGNGSRGFLKHTVLGVPTFIIWDILIILLLALIFYWVVRGSRDSPLDLL